MMFQDFLSGFDLKQHTYFPTDDIDMKFETLFYSATALIGCSFNLIQSECLFLVHLLRFFIMDLGQ